MGTQHNNIDEHFTPTLRALMGEWVTYAAIYTQLGITDDLSFLEKFEKGRLSDEQGRMYVQGSYISAGQRVYFKVYSMLVHYKIVKNMHDSLVNSIKTIVSFNGVKARFLKNIPAASYPIFPCFVNSALSLPKAEHIPFTAETGSLPLVHRFITEGYMQSVGGLYSWTPKIRPLMETIGFWPTTQHISQQRTRKQELEDSYLAAFNLSKKKQSIKPLIKFIKAHSEAMSISGMAKESLIPLIKIRIFFHEITSAQTHGKQVENRMLIEHSRPFTLSSFAIKTIKKMPFDLIIGQFKPQFSMSPSYQERLKGAYIETYNISYKEKNSQPLQLLLQDYPLLAVSLFGLFELRKSTKIEHSTNLSGEKLVITAKRQHGLETMLDLLSPSNFKQEKTCSFKWFGLPPRRQ